MSDNNRFSLDSFQRAVGTLDSFVTNANDYVKWDQKEPTPKGPHPRISEGTGLVLEVLDSFNSSVEEAAIGRLAEKPVQCGDDRCTDRALAFKVLFDGLKNLTMEVGKAQVAIGDIVEWQAKGEAKYGPQEDERYQDLQEILDLRAARTNLEHENRMLQDELKELKGKLNQITTANTQSNMGSPASADRPAGWRNVDAFPSLGSSGGETSRAASGISSASVSRLGSKPSSPKTNRVSFAQENRQRDETGRESNSKNTIRREGSSERGSVTQGPSWEHEIAEDQRSVQTDKTYSTGSYGNRSNWGSFPAIGVAQQQAWDNEFMDAQARHAQTPTGQDAGGGRDWSIYSASDKVESVASRSPASVASAKGSMTAHQSAADAGLVEGTMLSTSDVSERSVSEEATSPTAASPQNDSSMDQTVTREPGHAGGSETRDVDINAPDIKLSSAGSGTVSGSSAYNAWAVSDAPGEEESPGSFKSASSSFGGQQTETIPVAVQHTGTRRPLSVSSADTNTKLASVSSKHASRQQSLSGQPPETQAQLEEVQYTSTRRPLSVSSKGRSSKSASISSKQGSRQQSLSGQSPGTQEAQATPVAVQDVGTRRPLSVSSAGTSSKWASVSPTSASRQESLAAQSQEITSIKNDNVESPTSASNDNNPVENRVVDDGPSPENYLYEYGPMDDVLERERLQQATNFSESSSEVSRESSFSAASPVRGTLRVVNTAASDSGSDAEDKPVRQPLGVVNPDAPDSGNDEEEVPVRQPLRVVNTSDSDSSSMAEGSPLPERDDDSDDSEYDEPFFGHLPATGNERQPRESQPLRIKRLLLENRRLRDINENLNIYNEELEMREFALQNKERHFRNLMNTPGFGRIFYGEDIFVENEDDESTPRQVSPVDPPLEATGNGRRRNRWVELRDGGEDLPRAEETITGADTTGATTGAPTTRATAAVGFPRPRPMVRRQRGLRVGTPPTRRPTWRDSLPTMESVRQPLAAVLQGVISTLFLRSPWSTPVVQLTNARRISERRRLEWRPSPPSTPILMVGIPCLIYTVMALAAVQRERDIWLAANALTRRYMLDHAREDTAWWSFIGVDVDFLLRPSTMYYWILSLWQTSLVWLGYAYILFLGQAMVVRQRSRDILLLGRRWT